MRVRTEARRSAILETAAQVFLELGYERASMREIVERLGGSKGTLYSYFASKEELFMSVVIYKVGRQVDVALQDLVPFAHEDPRGLLVQFGRRFLGASLTPEAAALKRVIVAFLTNSEAEQEFRKRGPEQMIAAVEDYLAAATAAGRLRVQSPPVAARHLLALYEAEPQWAFPPGVVPAPTPDWIEQVVERAVRVFLAAYGVPEATDAPD